MSDMSGGGGGGAPGGPMWGSGAQRGDSEGPEQASDATEAAQPASPTPQSQPGQPAQPGQQSEPGPPSEPRPPSQPPPAASPAQPIIPPAPPPGPMWGEGAPGSGPPAAPAIPPAAPPGPMWGENAPAQPPPASGPAPAQPPPASGPPPAAAAGSGPAWGQPPPASPPPGVPPVGPPTSPVQAGPPSGGTSWGPGGPPAPVKPGGIPGCLKVAIVIGALLIVALIVFVVAVGNLLNQAIPGGLGALDDPDGGLGDCAFLSDADARAVLGGNADAIELSGLYDASIGLIIDKRVLPDAPDCWVTEGERAYIARVARVDGNGAAVFAQERANAAPRSEDQGGGITVEYEGWFGGEVAGLGDEAFCTGISPSIMAGVLVRQGDRVVYASVGPPNEEDRIVPDMGSTPDGVITAPGMCLVAQELARAALK